MIARISGKIIKKMPSSVIIQTGGLGFEILISGRTFEKLPDAGKDVELDIYTHVREDELRLVGFFTSKEKELFLKLLNVSGISIKIALSAFSIYGADELENMIINREVDLIKRIPGIGKKLAERAILELREKLSEEVFEGIRPEYLAENEKIYDVRKALKTLGYDSKEINKAMAKIDAKNARDMKTEDILKLVLKEV